MGRYIGVDLGGTKIAALLLDTSSEQVVVRTVIPTEGKLGADAVLGRIADLVKQVCQTAEIALTDIDGVGVGVPGTLDFEKGETLLLPNIPGDWDGKPVVKILQDLIGRPVGLINDARAFTLAEATLGAGRGVETVACFTLGTGIGGGLAINGKLHLGLMGSAGEVGHQSINFTGQPDGSGMTGGLEGYASGPAIASMGVKAVMQGLDTVIGKLVDFDLNKITPHTIKQAAEQGDEIAQSILDQVGLYLGIGIHNVITVVAPNRIVLGGGVASLGDWILKPIWKTLEERSRIVPLDRLEIVYAALGGDAGAIGAALWAGALYPVP
jgi:glucokinase